jgi:transposase
VSAEHITWVGMDAHKDSIKVAAFFPERPEPVEWTEATTVEAVRRLARKLQREAPGEVHCCYEAGPTGYALQRQLRAAGIGCTVIAPSLTPVKPGVRIKTDRRDARKLAELFRAGLVPSECSSGERERRGAITKAGNRHVRRLLVEAAWHQRYRPALSAPLRRRREGQPARVLAIADRAQERLYARCRRMGLQGKASPKIVVAMARELTGYLWAVLHPAAAATRV